MQHFLTKPFYRAKNKGFSLIELMIVVGIIGILATFAIPRFERFQAKARMAEAKTSLQNIYTLQESYRLETNEYTTFGVIDYTNQCRNAASRELGLEFVPCDENKKLPRYKYQGTAGNQTEFVTTAQPAGSGGGTVCPGGKVHTFAINETRNIGFTASGQADPGSTMNPHCPD